MNVRDAFWMRISKELMSGDGLWQIWHRSIYKQCITACATGNCPQASAPGCGTGFAVAAFTEVRDCTEQRQRKWKHMPTVCMCWMILAQACVGFCLRGVRLSFTVFSHIIVTILFKAGMFWPLWGWRSADIKDKNGSQASGKWCVVLWSQGYVGLDHGSPFSKLGDACKLVCLSFLIWEVGIILTTSEGHCENKMI